MLKWVFQQVHALRIEDAMTMSETAETELDADQTTWVTKAVDAFLGGY